jgi:hypothetical protein
VRRLVNNAAIHKQASNEEEHTMMMLSDGRRREEPRAGLELAFKKKNKDEGLLPLLLLLM